MCHMYTHTHIWHAYHTYVYVSQIHSALTAGPNGLFPFPSMPDFEEGLAVGMTHAFLHVPAHALRGSLLKLGSGI